MENVALRKADARLEEVAEKLRRLQANIETVIRGKPEVVQLCLVGLISRGHVLIEDIPGVGKSTLAHSIAASLGLSFQRIQFTSDLLPSDILGVTVFDENTREFKFRKGPIFANIILADEINRSTPKTQSALLEAMNDQQVTMDDTTHPLPEPFMVIATQNPIDHRGTFPLPDSQMDRFMMRVRMGYPAFEFERDILRTGGATKKDRFDSLKVVLSHAELIEIQAAVDLVHLSEALETYLLQIVEASRKSDLLAIGASTRGALALAQSARARALMQGRKFCLPDDVKKLAVPVLAHRLVVENRSSNSGRRSQDTEDIMSEIVSRIPVPL